MRIEPVSALIYMVYLQQHNQRTTPVSNVAHRGQERDQLVSEVRKLSSVSKGCGVVLGTARFGVQGHSMLFLAGELLYRILSDDSLDSCNPSHSPGSRPALNPDWRFRYGRPIPYAEPCAVGSEPHVQYF